MTMLVSIENLSGAELDLLHQQIMAKKTSFLEKEVALLREDNEKMKAQREIDSKEIETVKHRIDNLDMTNIDGTPQQRLNKMVRLYAVQKGLQFNNGWKDFVQAYNLAFSTNLTARHDNYKEKNGKCTLPEYLVATERIEDAVRVADKMLNKRTSLRAVN